MLAQGQLSPRLAETERSARTLRTRHAAPARRVARPSHNLPSEYAHARRSHARHPAHAGRPAVAMSVADFSNALTDRYRVERELGAGGMATVYLAYDVKHDRRVALKVLQPELAPSRRRAVPRRDQDDGEPAASAHSAVVRQRRRPTAPVLRDAVHRGRVVARADEPREAAARRRPRCASPRSRRRARLRAPSRRDSSRHQAREHSSARRHAQSPTSASRSPSSAAGGPRVTRDRA